MVGGKAHYLGYGRGSWPLSPVGAAVGFRWHSAVRPRAAGVNNGARRTAPSVYPLVRSGRAGTGRDGTGRRDSRLPGAPPRYRRPLAPGSAFPAT